MKALRIEAFGTLPEVLKYVDVEDPSLGGNQVRVRIEAGGGVTPRPRIYWKKKRPPPVSPFSTAWSALDLAVLSPVPAIESVKSEMLPLRPERKTL